MQFVLEINYLRNSCLVIDFLYTNIMSRNSSVVEVKYNKQTDDYYIELPDKLLSELNWKTGDNIIWTDNKNGTFTLTKEKE